MRTRTVWYEKRGITRQRFFELEAIAKQYDFYKTGEIQLSLQNKMLQRYLDRANAIETAAQIAGGECWPYILETVSSGKKYSDMHPPCTERTFHAMRRRFFAELHRLL